MTLAKEQDTCVWAYMSGLLNKPHPTSPQPSPSSTQPESAPLSPLLNQARPSVHSVQF